MKFWEFYVRRVHDLKPVLREELGETHDPDDLVYDVDRPGNNALIVTDVGVCVTPKAYQSTKYERYASVTRNVTEGAVIGPKVLGN